MTADRTRLQTDVPTDVGNRIKAKAQESGIAPSTYLRIILTQLDKASTFAPIEAPERKEST